MAKKFWMAAILTIHTSICRPCGGIVRSAKAYECGKCDVANGIPRYSDFRNVSTYTDNGFIGLNFDRPAMRQLQADVDAGLVGVVLVKDISRISRNHLDVPMFLDSMAAKGVVVKSIMDNFTFGETNTEADELTQARQNFYVKTIKALSSNKKPKFGSYIRVGSEEQLRC